MGPLAAAWLALASVPVGAQVAAGPEFQAHSFTSGHQRTPALAVDANGRFVMAWESAGQDGSSYGVFGQRFDATGTPAGAEFRINTYTTDGQRSPAIAAQAGGDFVVAWHGYQGGARDVLVRRFDAAGTPVGAELMVNTYTAGHQRSPAVAWQPGVGFVVVWLSEGQDASLAGVFGQRYDAGGTPLGVEFQVNTFTTSYQGQPAVASDAEGNFVVAWTSYLGDGSGPGIFAQRLDAAGGRRGAEFQVNTYTTNTQRHPGVASDGSGAFVVAWMSLEQDGSGSGIFAQRFDAAGNALGSEFRVNSFTSFNQDQPAVTADAVGNFVVAWQSLAQDANGYGIFAQRFGGLLPAALAVDSAGNGVLEPGENADVRPSWRNANGTSQTFGGGLSSFTGPAGADYGITDAAGDYATVPDGAAATCTDCYGVSLSNPPGRPALHWDASALEGIAPDAHGQRKAWTVHVGHSFTDVPVDNAFYRFIETLLHHSVTGGCAPAQYCPSSSTTRQQMAVFVLVSKEGVGYVPQPCGTPAFSDVPASSPFCPWIEELARRGVVGGCAPGLYCPASPVTRAQMGVFLGVSFSASACTATDHQASPPTR